MSQTKANLESVNHYKEELAKNGFVLFKGYLDPNTVVQAYDDLKQLFANDKNARVQDGNSTIVYDGPFGRSYLFKAYHLILEVYGKSRALDQLFEKILTNPISAEVLKFLAGDHIKMRGYNVRLMSGEIDPPPALELHRDNEGELGIGILLTDIEPGNNASTSFIPGSHLFPINAQKDCLFLMPYAGWTFFLKYNIFSKIIEKTVLPKLQSAWGKRGDFYFFINDSWHGRLPNLHGAQSMVFLAGAFPTEFPFPSHATFPVPPEVVKGLPPALQKVLDPNPPMNTERSSYIYQMFKNREKLRFFSIWNFARLERRLADVFSTERFHPAYYFLVKQYLKWIRPVLLPIARPVKRFFIPRKSV